MTADPAAAPPYDGVAVRLGARDWIVPPLNLRQLRRLAPKFVSLGSVGAGMGDEQIEALIEIAHAALGRNYPELTRDEVAELVDLGNAGILVKAIVGISGLVPAKMPTRARADASNGVAQAGVGESNVGEVGAGRVSSATPLASPTSTPNPSAPMPSTGTG